MQISVSSNVNCLNCAIDSNSKCIAVTTVKWRISKAQNLASSDEEESVVANVNQNTARQAVGETADIQSTAYHKWVQEILFF